MSDEVALTTELRDRHGVTTRARLRRAGLTDRQVDGLIRRGRLLVAARGVLVDAGAQPTFLQRVGVACAATRGVACFPTAAALWGFRKAPPSPDVHVAVHWTRRLAPRVGVVIHRSVSLPPCDLVRRADGIALTSPPRTLVDAAAVVSSQDLESMIEQGIDRGMFVVPTLWRVGVRLAASARAGSNDFLRVLASRDAGPTPVRSDYELRLERAMGRRGFPPLVREHGVRIGGGVVIHPDLGLPEDGFFVEVDHLTWHGGRAESGYDRWRDMKMHLLGLHVERVTDIAIDERLDETVNDLWVLWQRRRGELALREVANTPE
jgi:hypothetical protein